jgi:ATP-binding cassette subfamily B protein
MKKKQKAGLTALLWMAKHSKYKLTLAVVLAVLGVASGMLPYFMVTQITLAVLNGEADFKSVAFCCAFVLIGYTGKILFHGLSTTLSHQAAYTILKNIREKLAYSLYAQPLGEVLSKPSGEHKTIMVDTVERIEQPMAHIIPELISNVLVSLAMFIYIGLVDWRIALLALATIPLGGFFYKGLMKRYVRYYQSYIKANNHMNAMIVEYVNGIETIKAFNHAKDSYDQYTQAVERNCMSKTDFFKKTLWHYSAVMYVMPATLLFVLPGLLYFYMQETITVDALITCLVLSFGLVSPLIMAMNLTDGVAGLKTTLEEVLVILNKPQLNRPLERVQLTDYGLEFKNVTFAYGEDDVLRDVSFKVKPKGMTAIVGSSGSGKSTIGKLIMNFWDVKSGQIKLGGISMDKIPLAQSSQLISYVSQDNFLFDMTIKENIRIGKKNASDLEVVEAAKKASCHEFIMALELGYDTPVGHAGSRLSGGEKQRIAIARSMLKDSPVIVLDEATAYTDPENEVVIQESINTLVKNKSVIVIAHRLSTVKNADQIIVMDQGEIVSKGNHQELLTRCGHYNALWHAHVNSELIHSTKEVI